MPRSRRMSWRFCRDMWKVSCKQVRLDIAQSCCNATSLESEVVRSRGSLSDNDRFSITHIKSSILLFWTGLYFMSPAYSASDKLMDASLFCMPEITQGFQKECQKFPHPKRAKWRSQFCPMDSEFSCNREINFCLQETVRADWQGFWWQIGCWFSANTYMLTCCLPARTRISKWERTSLFKVIMHRSAGNQSLAATWLLTQAAILWKVQDQGPWQSR